MKRIILLLVILLLILLASCSNRGGNVVQTDKEIRAMASGDTIYVYKLRSLTELEQAVVTKNDKAAKLIVFQRLSTCDEGIVRYYAIP